MKLQGKTALVTGASRGIGQAIAFELAKSGITRLLLVARNQQRLAEIAADIGAMGVEVIPIVLDLTDRIQVNVVISQAWRDYGQIHLLVNCAGVAYQAPFLQSKLPHVQEEIAINLLGMYAITRLIARRMVSPTTRDDCQRRQSDGQGCRTHDVYLFSYQNLRFWALPKRCGAN